MLLKEEGVRPGFMYVVTSPEALNEWKELRLPYQWTLCYEDEIVDIDAIKSKVMAQLGSLLRDFIVRFGLIELKKRELANLMAAIMRFKPNLRRLIEDAYELSITRSN